MARNKSIFYKKLKCFCGANFKANNYRGRKVYTCSRNSNYGQCVRIPIPETFLVEVIEMHFQKQMNGNEISQSIDNILVNDRWDIEFNFVDGGNSLIKGNFMKY